MGQVIAFIGLGSNLGDRAETLQAAVRLLGETPGLRVLQQSTVIETKPVGPIADQPDFLNTVVRVETSLSPLELLDRLLAIEVQLGRVRDIRWGPRTIDLDLLLYGDQTIQDARLTVPHPEIERRPFVQQGLQELALHG